MCGESATHPGVATASRPLHRLHHLLLLLLPLPHTVATTAGTAGTTQSMCVAVPVGGSGDTQAAQSLPARGAHPPTATATASHLGLEQGLEPPRTPATTAATAADVITPEEATATATHPHARAPYGVGPR